MNFIRILLAVILLSAGAGGCSTIQLPRASSPDIQKLRDGENAFDLGQFREAEMLFAEVYDGKVDQRIRNAALYNLACTRIISASNTKELLAAIRLLDDWQRTSPSTDYLENPDMIITALTKQFPMVVDDKANAEKKRNAALSQLKKNKKIINTQNRNITELNSKLQSLEQQLSAFEAIDHQLQESKKAL